MAGRRSRSSGSSRRPARGRSSGWISWRWSRSRRHHLPVRLQRRQRAGPAARSAGRAADIVLSDMAAPTTGHPQTDHIRIMGLAELAYDFAAQVLSPGGASSPRCSGRNRASVAGPAEAGFHFGQARQAAGQPDSANRCGGGVPGRSAVATPGTGRGGVGEAGERRAATGRGRSSLSRPYGVNAARPGGAGGNVALDDHGPRASHSAGHGAGGRRRRSNGRAVK